MYRSRSVSCPTTHKSYTVYLKKFVIFVKADDYLIGDMSTMIPTLACFFYDLGRVCDMSISSSEKSLCFQTHLS